MTQAEIHKNKRKRITRGYEPYPHPKKKFSRLDNLVDFITIIFPFTLLPQLWTIWIQKSTEGVSLITWSLFLILNIPLFYYARLHKEKRLATMYFLFTIAYLLVIIGILLSR